MRRIWKILARILAAGAILLLVLVVGLKLFFPLEKAKRLAIEKAQEKLARPVAVGEVEVSLAGGLGVKLLDVEVGNPPGITAPPLLTAAAVDCKLAVWPLLKGQIQAGRLVLDKPRLELIRLADGTDNFTFPEPGGAEVAVTPGAAAQGDGLVASIDRVSVRRGEVGFQDQVADQGLRLFGLDLSASLASPGPNLFQTAGSLGLDSLQVQGPRQLPVLPLGLEFEAGYDLGQRRLNLRSSTISLADLLLQLEGEVNHAADALQATGRILAEDVPVADLLSLLPPAQREAFAEFDLAGRLGCRFDLTFAQGETEPLDYRGSVTVADLRCQHRESPGELAAARVKTEVQPDRATVTTTDGSYDGRPLQAELLVEDFADPRLEGRLTGQADLALAQPFLPADLEAQVTGPVSFALEAKGRLAEPQDLDFSGRLEVTGARVQAALLNDPVSELHLTLQADRRELRIEACRGRLGASAFAGSGSLTGLLNAVTADTSGPRLDLARCNLALDVDLDLAQAKPYLPQDRQADLAGRIKATLQLEGPLNAGADLVRSGAVEIRQLSYTDRDLSEPLQRLDAELKLAPDLVTVDRCAVRLPSSDFALTGSLRHALPYFLPGTDQQDPAVTRPVAAFTLHSSRLDLDRIFPREETGEVAGGARGASADTVQLAGMPDITGAGTVQVDTLIFNRIEFTALSCRARLENRSIICTEVDGRMYQGRATGEAAFGLQNLAEPTYTGSFQASQIEVDDFLGRFTPFGGMFYGKFDLRGEFDAAGREAATVRNTLTMDGRAEMHEGKVITSGFAYTALSGLAGKLGQELHKEQGLRDLATLIKVQDGKVSLDQVTTRLGQLGDLSLAGHYDFSGGIQYQGTLLLTPEQSQKLLSGDGVLGGLADLLGGGGQDERVALPLALSGTLDKPQFKVDYAALAERAGQNLTGEVQNKLQDLFK